MAKVFQITGDKQIDKFFSRLPVHLKKRVISSSYVEATKKYRKALKSNTPVRTGTLKKSVGIRRAKRHNGRYINPVWVGYIAKRGGWYGGFL